MVEADAIAQRPDRGAVALISGIAVGVAAVCLVRYGFGAETVAGVAFVAVLAVLSVIDVTERRIPNVIVLPAAAGAVAAVALLNPEKLRESALAGTLAFLFFFVPAVVMPRAIGMGDAKLALLIGLALGADTLQALLVGSLLAGAAGIAVLVSRGREAGRGTALPFAPFLAGGAVVALVAAGGCIYA